MRRIGMIFILLSASLAVAATPTAEEERTFLWNQANRLMFSASTPEDYLHAATRYTELIEQGARNADVFYNLGTALLRAEQYEPSIQAFERAEIYGGTTTDIRRNLQLARQGLNEDNTSSPAWKRALFLWHYVLPASVRGMIAALAFSLIWIALALKRLTPSYGWPTVVGISAVVCILFSSSFGISLVRTLQGFQPVQTQTLDAPAESTDAA